MKAKRRKVDIVVLSDIHLGTYGCSATELHRYLKRINPKKLILNGDIIDMWQFSKHYWPKSHMKIIKQILNFASKQTEVYYITGNHDETLRRFAGTSMGNLKIVNNLELTINGKKTWFLHGDIFDGVIKHAKWLAKLGAYSYDALIILNVFINYVSKLLGRGRVSLSQTVKDNVKSAVKFINNFESTVAEIAIKRSCDTVICGHIHHPENKLITIEGETIQYLNSGDWVENLTALECNDGIWRIYKYNDELHQQNLEPEKDDEEHNILYLKNNDIALNMLEELQL